MSEAGRINPILKNTYGCNPAGQPIFRISWSDAQLEKRFGVFNEFYGKIFLREVRGLREVPKYPYLKKLWVLERWLPPEMVYTPEVPETREGSYEPVFAFQNENYEPIPIIEDEVHKIIYTLFHPKLPGDRLSDMKAEEVLIREREEAYYREVLAEEGRTWIGHRLHSKEGIVRP